MKFFKTNLFILFLLLNQVIIVKSQNRVYVKEAASGTGASWSDAMGNLQEAINLAAQSAIDNDQITQVWVAKGTYYPSEKEYSTDERSAAFVMKNSVEIYGGFASTGSPTLNDRDYSNNITILSGDIGVKGDSLDNIYCIIRNKYTETNKLDTTAILDGFVVEKGYSKDAPRNFYGEAIDNKNASPKIKNCKLSGLYSVTLYLDKSNSTFENCIFDTIISNTDKVSTQVQVNCSNITFLKCNFINNTATQEIIQVGSDAILHVDSCLFKNNKTTCISFHSNSNCLIENSIFESNYAYNKGAAIAFWNTRETDYYIIRNCIFGNNNSRLEGGAIYISSADTVEIYNCLFVDNLTEKNKGGAINIFSTDVNVTNCTFYNNESGAYIPEGAAIFDDNKYGERLTVNNCIMWGEQDVQIMYYDEDHWAYNGHAQPVVTNSLVKRAAKDGIFPGTNNIMTYPLFADTTNNDLHLTSTSPCVNAGSNDHIPADLNFDLDGISRIYDNNIVDMGCYEYQGDPITVEALTGTVSISGTLQYGEELTANVTNTNNTGTLSYQWKRNDSNIYDATSSTYTLVENDIDALISVAVISSVETGSIESAATVAIEKAEQAAPATPTVEIKTHNSITLVTISSCDYAIDGGTWQTSSQFSELNAETAYRFTQRYTETVTHKASLASSALSAETDPTPVEALTGTVSISGTLQYGEELTANVTSTNNTGTLSYQWKRNESNINDATSNTHTLVENDIDALISVAVISSVETGSIESAATVAIEKAEQAAPAAPTVESKTHNCITLVTVSSCEYAIDGGTWQMSPQFSALLAETAYSFTQRYTETVTHKASSASSALSVETDPTPVEALTGTVSIIGTLQYGEELTAIVTNTNNTGILSYQWKRNDSNINGATSNTYTLGEGDIDSIIVVAVTSSLETGSIESVATTAVEKAEQATPAAPTVESKTHNSITLVTISGCEYAIDGSTWQTSSQFSALNAETAYSFTQRYIETATHKVSSASSALSIETNGTSTTATNIEIGKVKIYPNPTSEYIIVCGIKQGATIKLYNVNGNLLLQQDVNNDNTVLDVSGLNNGNYLLKVGNITKKVIIY